MKKKLLPVLAWIGVLLIISSCGKDEVPPLTNYSVPQARIKGKVYAELNLGSSGLEAPPSGLNILIRVNIRDLVPDPDPEFNYGYKQYVATLDQNGMFSVEVDATYEGITVTVFCDDFYYDQVQAVVDSIQPAPIRKNYSAGPYVINNVMANKVTIKDIIYTSN